VSLPAGVEAGVARALEDRSGAPVRVTGVHRIGGGSINTAARIETDAGRTAFVKWNAGADPRMFVVEAEGLRALGAGPLRVPEVLGVGSGDAGRGTGWLLLEHVSQGRAGPGYGGRLGEGLAGLHRTRSGPGDPDRFGWPGDNFIGSLPQANTPGDDWATFWRDRRLEPQLRAARDAGFLGGRRGLAVEHLLHRVDEALAPVADEPPALLHGDLWGGNAYAGPEGEPVLIDPAVYRGHREVDLAMSELFGGFPADFLDAYDAAWPLPAGYPEVRRPLYQLYYLLVHVNLFGAGYTGSTLRTLGEAGF